MRATRTSVFIQAIVIALLGFQHEWAPVIVPLGIFHLLYHWISSPRLTEASQGHTRIYQVHHKDRHKASGFPVNPTPDKPHWN